VSRRDLVGASDAMKYANPTMVGLRAVPVEGRAGKLCQLEWTFRRVGFGRVQLKVWSVEKAEEKFK